MTISQLVRKSFAAEIRFRGQEYYSNDQVELVHRQYKQFYFHVAGSFVYHVAIQWQIAGPHMNLHCSCSCPHFDGGDLCKHVWASLLFAEQEPELATVTKNPRPSAARENIRSADIAGDLEIVDPAELDRLVEKQNQQEIMQSNRGEENYNPIWQREIQRVQTRVQEVEIERRKREVLFSPLRKQYLPRQAHFVMDVEASLRKQKFVIGFHAREFLKGGRLGVMKPVKISKSMISIYPDPTDQNALWRLLGYTQETGYGLYRYENELSGVEIEAKYADDLLQELHNTGRFYVSSIKGRIHSVTVDSPYPLAVVDSANWELVLSLNETDRTYQLSGHLENGRECRRITDDMDLVGPFALIGESIARAKFTEMMTWFELVKKHKSLTVPKADLKSFLNLLFSETHVPSLRLPPGVEIPAKALLPKTQLILNFKRNSALVEGRLQFAYGHKRVSPQDTIQRLYDHEDQCFYNRSLEFEEAEGQRFLQLSPTWDRALQQHLFKEVEFVAVAEKAIALGWEVMAHQHPLSVGKTARLQLSSEVDWFDLKADFEFSDGTVVQLPQLLASLQAGERLIRLGDGTYGLLPLEWLEKFGPLAQFGTVENDSIRMSPLQALFLSSVLGSDPQFRKNERLKTFKKLITDLQTLNEMDPPGPFKGELRPYQKQGLFWLDTLRVNNLGGILADDMGLGKTVQVLALLCGQKTDKPTLIVAPKSLIFNWVAEAEKFAPQLRVLNLTGSDRHFHRDRLADYDVILTTYQTLRMDVAKIKDIEFSYFILDEAHYVKNSESQSFMACRMVKAERRLALTGTPIENSVSDLLSLLNIVTPGLLPESLSAQKDREFDRERLQTLSRSLRPFILRRTKDQVLKELPEKTEQVLYCELSPTERKKYDELKMFYWGNLTKKFAEKGFERTKIEILEALLRLRQAACHIGLLDQKFAKESSAKFSLLLDQLDSLLAEGHKVLVFSQFTSLLKILASRLEEKQVKYQYLDGKTTNREERITAFQNDPSIGVFLISLKAGGVGLNLTAANYVFILDPWWNPQAEAQAIDRVHRIGQKSNVFAYKIIAKDTVEEKVLELQKAKKELAANLLGEDKTLFKKLKLEDLSALFH